MLYALGDRKPVTAGNFYVAPGAAVIGDVHLGADTSVWFGAVVRGDVEPITLGRGCNVQDGSVLHADPGAPLVLDEFVTVGHQVMLHGCRIGRHSLIGIGSTILNRAVIGANCIVGAHALITEDKTFPDGVLILGAPAKVVRELTAEERASLPGSAQRYIDRAEEYRQKLSAV
jgi:carbonic anhydrase/acetyltransferase-like protein (isoleucine patch superfamily)